MNKVNMRYLATSLIDVTTDWQFKSLKDTDDIVNNVTSENMYMYTRIWNHINF